MTLSSNPKAKNNSELKTTFHVFLPTMVFPQSVHSKKKLKFLLYMKNLNNILFLQEVMFGRRNTNLNRLWKFQYSIIDNLHLGN